MWSITEIDFMNDDYVETEAEREREPIAVEVIQAREAALPKSTPLETLIARMRQPFPPALDQFLQIFQPVEGLEDFMRLIRVFLPDLEGEILEPAEADERIVIFCRAFSDRYFPIEDEWVTSEGDYANLIYQVPVRFNGISSYYYEAIPSENNNMEIILAYLLENPYNDSSDRPAYAEAAQKLLGKQVIRQIPKDGIPYDAFVDALKKTKFEPAAFWAASLSHNTGNLFFDIAPEDDDNPPYRVAWNKPTVDRIVADYQEAERQWGEYHNFRVWFEKDLSKNAEEIIRLIKKHTEPKTLLEIFGGENGDTNETEDNWPDPGENKNQGKFPDL